jgi:hypothetical protein
MTDLDINPQISWMRLDTPLLLGFRAFETVHEAQVRWCRRVIAMLQEFCGLDTRQLSMPCARP